MRQKLRSSVGRAIYGRRKPLIEPIFGVLKEQRGMRQFRRRGLEKVAVEMALAATAYNLTRMWNTAAAALVFPPSWGMVSILARPEGRAPPHSLPASLVRSRVSILARPEGRALLQHRKR